VSLLAVCPYCRATLLRRDLDVAAIGVMAALLPDSSPIQLGARGRWRGVGFSVIGRLQLQYPAGTWSEWHLLLDDGRPGWLGDAAGEYTVTLEAPAPADLPPWERLQPGMALRLGATDFEVADVREARIVAGEGELPFVVGPGHAVRAADLRGPAGEFATLDYGEAPPRVYVGETADLEALAMSGLRPLEGWTR
jgi:hypothetical protein